MYSFVFKNLIRVTKISDIRLRGSHGLLYMEQAKEKAPAEGRLYAPPGADAAQTGRYLPGERITQTVFLAPLP